MEIFLVCSYRRLASRKDPKKARLMLIPQPEFEIQNPLSLNPIFWLGLRSVHMVPNDSVRKCPILIAEPVPLTSVTDFFNSVIVELKGIHNRNHPEFEANFYDPIDRTLIIKDFHIELERDISSKYDHPSWLHRIPFIEKETNPKFFFVPDEIRPVLSMQPKQTDDWESLRSIFQWIERSFEAKLWWNHDQSRNKISSWFAPERNEDLRLLIMSSKNRPKSVNWDQHFDTVRLILTNKLRRLEPFYYTLVHPLMQNEPSPAVSRILGQISDYFGRLKSLEKQLDDREFVIDNLREILNPGIQGLLHKLWMLRRQKILRLAKSALEGNDPFFDKLLDRYQAKPPEVVEGSPELALKDLVYSEFCRAGQLFHQDLRTQKFDWSLHHRTKVSEPPSLRSYLFSRGQYQLMFHRNQLDILQANASDLSLESKVSTWNLESSPSTKSVLHTEWHLLGTVAFRVLYHENAWRHLFLRLKLPENGLSELQAQKEFNQTTRFPTDGLFCATLGKRHALALYADQKHAIPCLYYEIGETGLPTSYKKIDLKTVWHSSSWTQDMSIHFLGGSDSTLLWVFYKSGSLTLGGHHLDFAQSKVVEVCKNSFKVYREKNRHPFGLIAPQHPQKPTFLTVRKHLFILLQLSDVGWVHRDYILIHFSKDTFTKVAAPDDEHHRFTGLFVSAFQAGNDTLMNEYLVRREPASLKCQKYRLVRLSIQF